MTRASKSPSATWCTVVSTGTGPWPFLPRTGWSSSPATVTRTSSSASRYSGYSSSESSKSSAARSRTLRCASTMEPTIPTRPAVTRAEAGLPDPVRPRLARCLQPSDSAGAGLRIRAGSRSRSGPPVSDEFAGGCYHQSAEPDDDVDLAPDDGGRGQAEPAPVGDVGAVQRAGHRAEQALILGVLGRADPPGPQEGDVPEIGGGGGENREAQGTAQAMKTST